MADVLPDDPGELIRFWLWHEYRHTVRSFKVANLAKGLGSKPAAVSAWLYRHAIPSIYWNPIARHFKGEGASYRTLEDEALALWRKAENRRGYVPLRDVQKKRQTAALRGEDVELEHPETPAHVAAYLRESDAATRSRRPRRPARAVKAGKTHGKRRGA